MPSTKEQYMNVLNILADNVTISHHQRKILSNIKGHYMKESNTLVGIVSIKQLQRAILLNTSETCMCMKESNTVTDNVGNSFLRDILLFMQGQCMKESSILVTIVASNLLTSKKLLNT